MHSSPSCACDFVPNDWYKLSIVDLSGDRQHLILGSCYKELFRKVKEKISF